MLKIFENLTPGIWSTFEKRFSLPPWQKQMSLIYLTRLPRFTSLLLTNCFADRDVELLLREWKGLQVLKGIVRLAFEWGMSFELFYNDPW